MAKLFKRLGIDLLASGGTDVRVRVSVADDTSGFLNDKLAPAVSGKITKTIANAGGNEQLLLDVDETNIDHNVLTNYDVNQHRDLDDAATTATNLWSADKIQTELDGKINAIPNPVADNRLTKTIGLDGNDLEQTGISVSDTDDITGVNDLTISGNLTVNGTTTTVNSATLEVTDANITVNNGGTQASANSQSAGLTVEMSDATDAVVGYDSTLTSKFKIGETGDLREVATTTHTQSFTNKTINADNNTISNLETDNLKAGVLSTDLNNLVDDTNLPSALSVKTYVAQELATQDEASEIAFNPATSTLVDTDVQSAIDSLDAKLEADIADLAAHEALTSGVHGVTGDVVGTTDTQTLTNKTINARNNTVQNINTTDFQAGVIDEDLNVVSAGHDTLATALAIKTYVDAQVAANLSAGDILETSFTGANNVSPAADVTGFAFSNAVVRSFVAQVSVSVDATTNLYQVFEIRGIQLDTGWNIDVNSTGQNSLVEFSITPTGQIQYTSGNYTGFASLTIKFRADTTSI